MRSNTNVMTTSQLWERIGRAYGEVEKRRAEVQQNRSALDELHAQLERAGMMPQDESKGGFLPPRRYT